MIHYHGGPITPLDVARTVWTRRHAFVSFHRPEQVAFAAEVCQSFAIDNGAFSHWKAGNGSIDAEVYAAFVRKWARHPAFDWCLAPDVIDGDEAANDEALDRWQAESMVDRHLSVPVWHLHESTERLVRLCRTFSRVALGSSGRFSMVGDVAWMQRMGEAMQAICDADGRPMCKLHGLRMLNPTVFSHYPFASADSTNAAQNHNRTRKLYQLTPAMAALTIVDRIESHASAPRWNGTYGLTFNMDLVG